jgi:ribosome-associated protein
MSDDLVVTARVRIPEADLRWSAVRSSGPGGQHVNRTASKVQLWFDLEGTRALGVAAKERLRTIAVGRLDAEGYLLVSSQETRDQRRNLEDARRKLAQLIRAALVAPKPRRKTKPSRASVARRLDAKRKRADTKRGRSRVGDD